MAGRYFADEPLHGRWVAEGEGRVHERVERHADRELRTPRRVFRITGEHAPGRRGQAGDFGVVGLVSDTVPVDGGVVWRDLVVEALGGLVGPPAAVGQDGGRGVGAVVRASEQVVAVPGA